MGHGLEQIHRVILPTGAGNDTASSAVSMAMVNVGIVRMPVHHRRVPVPVAVRLAGRCTWIVSMLVVGVVAVAVLVLQRFMGVLVLMPLGEMQPEAERHKEARDHEVGRNGLAEQGDGEDRAHERRQREIGAGPRRAEMAQREHEQGEADAIAEEADHRGRERQVRAILGIH